MSEKNENQESINILQVRNHGSSIYIHWTQGKDDYPVTFHDVPLPGFYSAIEALNRHVITLSEFPEADLSKIEATGITVSQKGENAMACIIAKKKLQRNKRVLNITTPILPMYASTDKTANGGDHMSEEEAAAIELVVHEAKLYLRGERAQGKLELGDKPKLGRKAAKAHGPAENIEQFPEMK